MDIGSINNQLSSYLTSSAEEKLKDDTFKTTLENASKAQDMQGLKEACREFESYFLKQTFDQMRKTVPESGLLEASAGREIYEDMLYEEYAKNISSGSGIGIAQMLYKQLSKDETTE